MTGKTKIVLHLKVSATIERRGHCEKQSGKGKLRYCISFLDVAEKDTMAKRLALRTLFLRKFLLRMVHISNLFS